MAEHTQQDQPPHTKVPLRLWVALFAVALLAAGALIFTLLYRLIEPPPPLSFYDAAAAVRQSDTQGLSPIYPPREVSDFTLMAHTGQPLSLSDLRGRYVLFFFGYTHCPDVCPLTLVEFQKVHQQLGEDAAAQVAFLFISVDGERDTPQRLKRYFEMRGLDAFMLGMQGENATLRRITPDYGLFFQAQPTQPNGYYAVDHSASTYLLDPQGRLTHIFAFGTRPEVITEALQALLAG